VAATGDGPGRSLVVASPSGFALLITEAGTPDEAGGGVVCGPGQGRFPPRCRRIGRWDPRPSRDRTRPNAAQHA